ncbi:MAG: cell wall-binding repeat-containing protein, partial [Acidimicrobiales bacterium]
GSNRSKTSLDLANFALANLGFSKTTFDVASGANRHLVDSLTGSSYGGVHRAPTLVTANVNSPGAAATFARQHAATEQSFVEFGGTEAISRAVEAAIEAAGRTGTPAPPPVGPPAPVAATVLPQLLSARVVSTHPFTGTTVEYTFSKPVLSATKADFRLYTAQTAHQAEASGVTVRGSTVTAVFSGITGTTGTGTANIHNYTLATVASGAVHTGSGRTNPDGSVAIGAPSVPATLTPGKTNAPDLVSVTGFRNYGTYTLVDFNFDKPVALQSGTGKGSGNDFGLVSQANQKVMGAATSGAKASGNTVTVKFANTTLATAGITGASTTARGFIQA